MNKSELIEKITSSLQGNFSKKQVDQVLTAILEEITEAVSHGDKVALVGFGVFEARDRKSRQGRNPKTGEVIQIPATRVPVFVSGKLFRESVMPLKLVS